jgi:AraC-like DNA-binding protein
MKTLPPASARLQEWANVHTQLLWSYRGLVHPKGRDSFSRGKTLFGWLLLHGSCTTKCPGGMAIARAGEWMLPPFGPRHQKFSRGARIISVAFRADWPGGQSLYDHGAGRVIKAADFPDLKARALEQLEYIEREFPQASNQLFLEVGTLAQHWELQVRFAAWLRAYAAMAEQIGIEAARPWERDPRLDRAVQLIERHALNRPFREAVVAREAGLSVAQFHRLFVRQFARTPRERFEERRQQAAVALVEQSQRPLKVVAADLGFSSPSHFSRWFARRQRVGPRELRRKGGGACEKK